MARLYSLALLLTGSTIASVLSLVPIQTSAVPPKNHAVVVGAGPVGIAAALTLASHHNYTVTLLESSPPSSDQTKYDPTKAFLYNVNLRGQTFTKQFPNLHQKLVERSVTSAGMGGTRITIVPADPDEEIPEKANIAGTSDSAKGSSSSTQPAAAATKEDEGALNTEKAVGVGYWIPRHEMVKLMADCIEEHNSEHDCKIDFQMGQDCVAVLPTRATKEGDDASVCVTAQGEDGTLHLHEASLVVGADGMNSKVRGGLAETSADTWRSHRTFNPKKFIQRKWTSPASYLRIKVLQLPPRFEIPNANGKPALKTMSEEIYSLRGVNNGPRDFLFLGLLPMRDNSAVRPTNIVTRPDHEVWEIKDGTAMREYFQRTFPRYDFDTMISPEEWERFAKAKGTRFPPCQYSEGLAVWDATGKCGVVLVGDALHSFSPDIGQGVNAGLMDVVSLDRALKGCDPETGKEVATTAVASLKDNLERYQQRHGPEVAALIRLARFGAPYQYNQPHRADRILKKLWTANVALRLILNKLTFGLVPASCIILSQNADLTYRQVMRRADWTTAVLRTLVLGGVGLWVKSRFGLGFLKMPPLG